MRDIRSRVDEIVSDFNRIKKSLNLDTKAQELKVLESKSTDPDLWNNQKEAVALMQKIGDIRNEIDLVSSLEKDLQDLKELSKDESFLQDLEKELSRLGNEINKLKTATYLSGLYDAKNAIVSIHAGQGGTEAMDWAGMLFRMYFRFCERKNWKVDVLDETEGEEAGIKTVTFKVSGRYAYGYLKNESGTHRLVRQSPFNADKLRQTSFALVEVLPEFEDIDLPDIEIKDEDLDWQFFRASSQGGQNVQKVSTAVRLKHIPTGIVVTAQSERFQQQNRKIALTLLRAKLWAKRLEEAKEEKEGLKGEYRPASWGTQIRSYVLHPYKMVKDLRTEVETGNTDAVLDGDLDEFIEAELKSAI